MTKPVVLAIMGPSASGKDTLAQELVRFLNKQKIWGYITDTSHLIVSDTTRPKRVGELPGYDYNFITAEEFAKRDTAHMYIDTYVYGPKCWSYGTQKSQLCAEINVGVFSPSGLTGLERHCKDGYRIIPILLDAPKYIRLWRSVKRDKGFSMEHLRRMRQDTIDFDTFKESVPNEDLVIELDSSKKTNCKLVADVYNILCDNKIVHTIWGNL